MVKRLALTILVTGATLGANVPFATSAEDEVQPKIFRARLHGYNEVPSVSTAGRGHFGAQLSENGTFLTFKLTLARLSTRVTSAHIHFGQSRTRGGVMVRLCGPRREDEPAEHARPCIATDGAISGTITAANVIGPRRQGIAKGEFRELISALRARAGYVDVHTVRKPSGEIRGQIR